MASGARLCRTHDLLIENFGYLQPPIATSPTEELSEDAKLSKKELQSTLFCAAQASRALSEHALDVLWRRLDNGMIPLLCLLTPFGPFWSKENTALLHCDVTDENWQRFKLYAQRVRILPPRLLGQPLLPNLLALSVLPIHVTHPNTLIVLSPTLRRLHFTFTTDWGVDDLRDEPISMLLQAIDNIAPELEALHLHRKVDFQYIRPSSLYALERFERLQHIELDNSTFDLRMLQWAAGLESLDTLRVSIRIVLSDLDADADSDADSDAELDVKPADLDWEDSADETSFYPDAFSALRHLFIRGTPSDLSTFVHSIPPPPLLSLGLDISGYSTRREIIELFSTCVGASASNAGIPPLEDFAISNVPVEWKYESSLLEIVTPLLQCRKLKRVFFGFASFPGMKDDDVTCMARSWPELIRCRALPTGTPSYPPVSDQIPTLASLCAFAKYCPKLTELSLPDIDLRRDTPMSDVLPSPNHPLRSLQAAFRAFDRGSDRLLYAAQVIDRLFPLVTVVLPPKSGNELFLHIFDNDATLERRHGGVKRHVEELQRKRRLCDS